MTSLKMKNANVVEMPLTAPKSEKKTQLKSLELMRTPRSIRPVLLSLLLLLLVVVICLLFVPWQQSVTGYGRVIVFSPMDRPQSIEAQIPGRIVRWNIAEGQLVRAGEIIAEIQDIDSKFLIGDQVERLRSQQGFMQTGLQQSFMREAALGGQLGDLEKSRNLAIPTAEQRVRQAEDRVVVAQQNLEQARQSVT
ncbi:MAG TPA: biotin/lipoyl-binding protein, partial [Blastocatellia bacterium]